MQLFFTKPIRSIGITTKLKEMKIVEVVKKIDFEALRNQKLSLLQVMEVTNNYDKENLDGILSLIDAIQDAVVEDGIEKESVVFKLEEDEI